MTGETGISQVGFKKPTWDVPVSPWLEVTGAPAKALARAGVVVSTAIS
jgi:hypothetical protein